MAHSLFKLIQNERKEIERFSISYRRALESRNHRNRRNIVPSRRAFLTGLGAAAITLPALAASDLQTFNNGASGSSVRTTLNTLITRFQDILNAKDWGATGNGVTDDTAAIQAMLDAAYGTTISPNGTPLVTSNKAVFFPNGSYKVSSPTAMTVSNATRGSDAVVNASASGTTLTINSVTSGTVAVGQEVTYTSNGYSQGAVIVSGSGSTWTMSSPFTFTSQSITLQADVIITVNSTTNYLSGIVATIASTVTTPTDVINGERGIAIIDGTRFAVIRSYSGAQSFTSYSSGGSVTRAALNLRNVRGACILGAGRFTTSIQNTSSLSVFSTNGFEYSIIGGIQIITGGTGVGFDLNWDNTGTTALQSNTFRDMFFEGGAFGCRIGTTGFMGSENIFLNCYFANGTTAGLCSRNGNALQNSVIGGNFQGCTIGVWAASGSIPVIQGVGFQQFSTNRDIQIDNSYPDSYFIGGCRSESQYFAHIANGPGATISGCVQTNATAGTFLFYEAGNVNSCILDNCYSVNGVISSFSNGRIWIRGGSFGNASFVPSSMGSGGRIMQWDFGPVTVANLPTAATHLQGLRATVTDANATTFGTTAAGGGSNVMGVICTGSVWKYG